MKIKSKSVIILMLIALTVLFYGCSNEITTEDNVNKESSSINPPSWIQGSYSNSSDSKDINIQFTSDSVIFNDDTNTSLSDVSCSSTGSDGEREFDLYKSGISEGENISVSYKFNYKSENRITYTKTINDEPPYVYTLNKDSSGTTTNPTRVNTPNWLQGSFSNSTGDITVKITSENIILGDSSNTDSPVIDFAEYSTGNMTFAYFLNNYTNGSTCSTCYGVQLSGSYEGQFFNQWYRFDKVSDSVIYLYYNIDNAGYGDNFIKLNRDSGESTDTITDEVILPPDWLQDTYVYDPISGAKQWSIEFTDNDIIFDNYLNNNERVSFSNNSFKSNMAYGKYTGKKYQFTSGTASSKIYYTCTYIDDSSFTLHCLVSAATQYDYVFTK